MKGSRTKSEGPATKNDRSAGAPAPASRGTSNVQVAGAPLTDAPVTRTAAASPPPARERLTSKIVAPLPLSPETWKRASWFG